MRIICAVFLILTCSGCPPQPANEPQSATPVPSSSKIVDLPVSLQLQQRSTTEIPGTEGKLSLTIDDITHSQVMVTLNQREAANLLGPISLKSGEKTTFRFGEHDYILTLTKLNNQLIGDDDATLTISDTTSTVLSEDQKIQHLISAVESLSGCTFIRNGSEHTPHEAAEHLRRKLNSAGGNIHTVDDFITQIAASSSLSGEEYQIRFQDGRTLPAHEYLREELQRMNNPPTSTVPSVPQ